MSSKGNSSKYKFKESLKGKSIKELKEMRLDLEKELMAFRGKIGRGAYTQGMTGNMKNMRRNIARIEGQIHTLLAKQGRA